MLQFKKLIIFLVIVGAALLAPQLSLAAVDPGFEAVEGSLNLSDKSPLSTATTIISFLFGFLGFLAVSLILWGGFIWMTSGGNEDKIAQAKKILKNSAIGLLLILSAWGITYFVVSKILDVTGGTPSDSTPCINGSRISCGCANDGEQICNGNSWGPCLGASTCLPDVDEVSCDGNAVLSGCQADNNVCGSEYLCDETDCICKPKVGLGQSCDSTPGGSCQADNNLCGPYLKCDESSCLCVGPPVITGISPLGGFCNNDENRACNNDQGCLAGGICDTTTPNGAANNFLTIYGYNFNSALTAQDQLLVQSNFDTAALGSLPAAWRTDAKSGSSVVISKVAAKSPQQSLLIHQDKDLPWPGKCSQAQCATITGCVWSGLEKTCSFNAKDECKKTVPAVYNENENLCYPNANVNVSVKLYYDAKPLNLELGKNYSIKFYYKGKNSSNLSISFGDNQCLGYGSAGALKPEYSWNGANLSPVPQGGDEPCNPSYGTTCSEQSNTCCANAPYQKKCYSAVEMTPILSGTYGDWYLYSYTFQYTPEMETWVNKSNQKNLEFIFSTAYASTGDGTDLYIDDFSISKISEIGQVTFLGADNSQAQIANYPKVINPSCISSWTDRQIIIAVPSGAADGPIKVERENSLEENTDTTNDDIGPKLADFVKNNISRPGLCSVSPTRGLLGEKIEYQGINLMSGEAYFGNYTSSYKGINSNFTTNNLSGQTLAPSIMPGKTTTFVEGQSAGVNQQSNTLVFIKDRDPEMGPYISSFDPIVGQAGQYVTISGRGFGSTRGSRQVYFGDKEAVYDFPEVCTNSVWSNDQIIVKVPEGLSAGSSQIKINLGDTTISSALLSPSTFRYDATVPLKAGLCKIDPTLGQVGAKVDLWGEYFGAVNTPASVVFNSNKSTSSLIIKDGQADKVTTAVPADSITGPVYILKNSEQSNEVNFTVGKCSKDSECSSASPICCPGNTYKTGSCASSIVSCYFDVPNSVYETSFNTGYSSTEGPEIFDSCAGMATYFGSCQTGQFCPNSPGKCSPYSPQVEVGATCGTTYECGNLNYCKNNQSNCTYNQSKDVCVANSCQLAKEYEYSLVENGQTINLKGLLSCRTYNGKTVKHIDIKTTCPDGWSKTVDGFCASSIACENCSAEFTCKDDNSGDDIGKCESAEVCTGVAYCGQNPNNFNQFACLSSENKNCDCCCEIGKDTECCAPLKCAGTCGSDQSNDGTGLGSCSGCSDAGSTVAENDAACNCSTASGKFCDTTKPGGICVDCAALDQAGCSLHSAQCCFDASKNTCQGGNGSLLPGGFCAYYDCDVTNKTTCNATATTTGQFLTVEKCTTTCATDPQTVCDKAVGSEECSKFSGCCFDTQNNKCTNGTDKLINTNNCARYDCVAGDENSCKIASSTGAYLGAQNCVDNCNESQPGASCASDTPGVCDVTVCGNPYQCLSGLGQLPSSTECGFCCCKPGETNGALTCKADQGDCSGASRGLFCGCTEDEQCGSKESQGCGVDTCCHARPKVVTTKPANNSDLICRNSQVVIDFSEVMSTESLASNILLLEEKEYGTGVCPEGTLAVDSNFIPLKNNIFAKLYRKLNSTWRGFFGASNSAIAAIPDDNKLYCKVQTLIGSEKNYLNNGATSTRVYVRPKKVMAANTNYFVVVRGDKDFNSNFGVLSENKVGLSAVGSPIPQVVKFNTTSFPESYVFNFKTMETKDGNSGLCAVNNVQVEPVSFLIRTSKNETSDDDYTQVKTFDTQSDSDRALSAYAYSTDGQVLQPVTGYFWNWQWTIANTSVASWSDIAGLPANKKVVSANDKITDNSTTLTAKVVMDNFSTANSCKASPCECVGDDCSNKCCNITLDGSNKEGVADMYVFLCTNPWPIEKAGLWIPWADVSYDKDGKPVINHNYKFYYCRDYGEEGTHDDLPAIDDSALILGSSATFLCSEGGGACDNQGAICGPTSSGVCVWSVLKESYFFRGAVPRSGEITNIFDTRLGGQIQLTWRSPVELVDSYKIYYGAVVGNTASFVVTVTPETACVKQADNITYVCNYKVNDLIDGQKYNFMVSVVSPKKTESPLSGGKELASSDKTAPAIPTGLTGTIANNTTLKLSWLANTDDTLFYRVYHGVLSGKYGESFDSKNKTTFLDINISKYAVGDHFFAVSAIDEKDNQSNKSVEFKITTK